MTKRKKAKHYTLETKMEAIRLHLEEGLTQREVVERLDLGSVHEG